MGPPYPDVGLLRLVDGGIWRKHTASAVGFLSAAADARHSTANKVCRDDDDRTRVCVCVCARARQGKEGERREIEYLNPRTGQEARATVELDCQAEFQREGGSRFLANSAGLGGVPMTPLHMPAAQPVFHQQPQMTVLQSPAFQPQPMPFFQGGLQPGPIMGGGGALMLQPTPLMHQTPLLAAQPMPVLAYGGGGGGFGGPVYF